MCAASVEDFGTEGRSGRGGSVIGHTVAILRCFRPDRQVLGVTEIAAEVGLHKSSVSRVLAALERERIVERDSTKRYRLGLGIITIAGSLLADLDVRRAAAPTLQRLTETTGETSALMVWNATEAITVEQIPSPRQVKHTSPLGSRYQTALSASVQVFLSVEREDRVRDLLGDGSVLANGQDPDDYLTRLRNVGEHGYAVNHAETSEEEIGVSAPVRDHRGVVSAAVLIPAPRFRVDEPELSRLIDACTNAAQQVTRRLGGR